VQSFSPPSAYSLFLISPTAKRTEDPSQPHLLMESDTITRGGDLTNSEGQTKRTLVRLHMMPSPHYAVQLLFNNNRKLAVCFRKHLLLHNRSNDLSNRCFYSYFHGAAITACTAAVSSTTFEVSGNTYNFLQTTDVQAALKAN
jgi:hypothetical protein